MTLEEIAEVRPRLVDVTAEMLGRTPGPAYPGPAVNLRQLALAHADTITPVAWRQGTRAPGPPQATRTPP